MTKHGSKFNLIFKNKFIIFIYSLDLAREEDSAVEELREGVTKKEIIFCGHVCRVLSPQSVTVKPVLVDIRIQLFWMRIRVVSIMILMNKLAII